MAVSAMISTNESTSLVEQAQGGSVEAFERLYRNHVDRIYALCLRMAGDPAAAEELTQDVFVRAWKKLDSFRGESKFSSWLHRLAVNVVLTRRRSDGRRHARIMTSDDPAQYESGGRPASIGDRMDLEAAIATLSESARTVFVLHEVEGYTHEEIAEMTGRAEGTCKALLHRARKSLREMLLR